jgi:hypothetical protein
MKRTKVFNKRLGRFIPFKSNKEASFFLNQIRFLAGKEYENLELVEYDLDNETEKFAPDNYFFEDKRARWVR